MDRFLVLTTFSDHLVADSTCGMLEQAGIPVMLEHVEIIEEGVSASGIRILVPSDCAQRAMKILDKRILGNSSTKENEQQWIH